jgi:ATP-binding cassette subfamily F protein 3
VGQLKPLDGDRHTGEHSRIGYFAQHQLEALDLNASPLLHIQRISPQATEQEIRNFLGGFDFHGDDALGSIGHFSGGEKARLALAIVTWQAPALLLLDEPTNHLDLEMRHALTLALQNFPGAVVIVSHDRHLLRNCVDDFLLVAEGRVVPFDGDLDDYHQWLSAFKARRDVVDKPATLSKNLSADDKRKQKQREADIRKQLSPLKKQLDALEKSVDRLQTQLDAINEQLADASLYDDDNKKQLNALLAEQATLTQRLNDDEEAWMEAQENYDALFAELQSD